MDEGKNIRGLSDHDIVQLIRRIREDLSKLETLAHQRGRRGRRILGMYYRGKISYNEALRMLK